MQVLATTSGLARRLDMDARTVERKFRCGEIQPAAYLRFRGRYVPLFETGLELHEPEMRPAEADIHETQETFL